MQIKRREEKQSKIMKESFTSTVSHELKTPLFTIIIFLQEVMKMLSQ